MSAFTKYIRSEIQETLDTATNATNKVPEHAIIIRLCRSLLCEYDISEELERQCDDWKARAAKTEADLREAQTCNVRETALNECEKERDETYRSANKWADKADTYRKALEELNERGFLECVVEPACGDCTVCRARQALKGEG